MQDTGHFHMYQRAVLEKSHEELTSKLIMESALFDILSEKFDPMEIIKIISGEGSLGQIISLEILMSTEWIIFLGIHIIQELHME